MAENNRDITDGAGMRDSGWAVLRAYAQVAAGRGTAYPAAVRVMALSLTESDASLEQWQKLVKLLKQLPGQNLEPPQLAVAIETKTPFQSLARMLPDTKGDAYQFIGMLAQIVSTIIAVLMMVQPTEAKPTITPEQVEEIIARVVEHQDEQEPTPTPGTPTPTPTLSPSTPASPHPSASTAAQKSKQPLRPAPRKSG